MKGLPSVSPQPATRLTFGILVVLVVPSALAAQDFRDTVRLADLVVTADRVPTPSARVVASTTVITGESLRERGVYFVEEALREVPGATIVSSGSYGGNSALFLRGGESDYVKVLVDGVPVNQPGGAIDLSTLTTDNVERIEIVRGPASVQYGSDAMTGVIQIFTRRGSGRLTTEATARAGSHGNWNAGVGVSGGSEQTSYSASLSRAASDGFYRFNNDYTNTVASGALTVRPDSATDLTLTARTGDGTYHYPTDGGGAVVDHNQYTQSNGSTIGLDAVHRVSSTTEFRLLLASHSETDGAQDAPDGPADTVGFFGFQSEDRILRRSADARALLQPLGALRLTLGGTAEFEELRELSRSEFNFGGGPTVSADPPFSPSRHSVAGYAQAVVDVTPRALLNLGARVEANQGFGTHLTVRAGSVYALGGGLRARASLGTGYKEPSIRENYASSPFEVGNPDLKPEQSTSWEVGLEQNLAEGRATLSATWFDGHFNDLIQYDGGAAPGAPNYQNVARATSRGLELSAAVRPLSTVTLGASYSYLKTRVDDAGFSTGAGDVFVEGKPLIRRPSSTFRLDGRARLRDRLSLGATVNLIGSREDVDFGPFPSVRRTLPSYTLVDVDAALDLLRSARPTRLAATLRVENLLDASYQSIIGFRGRPRSVLGGARVTF